MAPMILDDSMDESTDGSAIYTGDSWTPDSTDGEQDLLEPIAIIGLSLKFPQDATSPESFWKMLMERRCASTEFPKDRMNVDAFYNPDTNRMDTIPMRGAHFIRDDIRAFDAPFFSITPTEAAAIDPQQRGLLETTYKALENGTLFSDHVVLTGLTVMQLVYPWRRLWGRTLQSILDASPPTIHLRPGRMVNRYQSIMLPVLPLPCCRTGSVGSTT